MSVTEKAIFLEALYLVFNLGLKIGILLMDNNVLLLFRCC
ncbi:unknown [Bacteroides sp. CAG:144]|nr:unknown [Bacteroides sp. CAG:144]